MQNRRIFIKKIGLSGAALVCSASPLSIFGKAASIPISILYTNDTQSQIEPFPSDAPLHAGMGGVQARADLLKKIRAEVAHTLLLDTGDYFQGSPYFDVFKGAPEIGLMNQMQYDAVGIGEHEFDEGIENLALQISKANFPVLCANYSFKDSSLEHKINAYTIIKKETIKIGIMGIGRKLEDTAYAAVNKQIAFLDPIKTANETAHFLRHKKQCDFIICLSHLGIYNNGANMVNDTVLAKESRSIDLIIGGHSHTLLEKPLQYWNKDKKEILVTQAGWGGVHLGRIDYLFSTQKSILSSNAQTVEIGK